MRKRVPQKIQDIEKLGANLRALDAAGSRVDCSVAGTSEENTEVEICLVGGIHDSMVFELPDGRTGYILDSQIINQTSKTICLFDAELRMSWEDPLFAWLPDPKETGRTESYFVRKNGRRQRVEVASESYYFGAGIELDYPRELVLNHVLLKGRGLQPRCPLLGLLLATGGPMPHDLRHGQWLEPTLVLIASNHREYTGRIRLWTERLEIEQKAATRVPDLYRNPVRFPVDASVVVGNERCATHIAKLNRDRDRHDRISL
jgi:hypothetical protein